MYPTGNPAQKSEVYPDIRVRISSTFSVLRPLYFDRSTSTRLLRPFVKSGFLVGREVQVELQFSQKGRSKV